MQPGFTLQPALSRVSTQSRIIDPQQIVAVIEDDKPKQGGAIETMQLNLVPYDPWDATVVGWAILFRILLLTVWFLLQVFSTVRFGVDGQSDEYSILRSAVVRVLLFQVLRFASINLLIVINLKLPTSVEVYYFAQYAVQLLFYFYYRNIFLNYSSKLMTIR